MTSPSIRVLRSSKRKKKTKVPETASPLETRLPTIAHRLPLDLSAVVSCSRSSRGVWRTCLASRWSGGGDYISIAEGAARRPSACTRQLSEVRVSSLAVMQLPFATRHAFSDDHPATYEAVLVLVLAKASLRMTGAKRDKNHGEKC